MRTTTAPRLSLALTALLLAGSLATTANAQSATVGFAPKVDYDASSSEPREVVVADVDGDLDLDVVIACSGQDDGGGKLSLMLNEGALSFDEKSLSTGGGPWGVCVADFDEDGLPDLAVANGFQSSASVALLRGTGGGNFAAAGTLPAGSFPIGAKAADLDGDGHLDLVLASNVSGGFRAYLGNGDLTFGAAIPGGGGNATDLALGDVNGDGLPDVVLAHYNGVTSYRNNGDGSFTAFGSAGTSNLTESVALGDLDRDGNLDAVTGEIYSGMLRVCLGNGAGGFATVASVPIGSLFREVEIADVNGDGIPDVLAVSDGSSTVKVLLGAGDGTLSAPQSFGTGLQPTTLASGDFDGDGRAEVVAGCRNLGDTPAISVLANQSPPAAWSLLGAPLADGGLSPLMLGAGTPAAGNPVAVNLSRGPAAGTAYLIVGFSALNAAFKGGQLVPNPDLILPGLPLDGAGALGFPFTWPATVPAGTHLWWQAWMPSAAGSTGWLSSNGLKTLSS